ncbi:MAG: hypothetical protein ACRD7E_27820, partial [Bryobacteraceae bacterium]
MLPDPLSRVKFGSLRLPACIFLFAAVTAAQAQHELLLKGGHVIDPKNQIDARMDVAISKGLISAVA